MAGNDGKIYKAILACMNDIGAVGKNSKNAQQGFMFRGIDAVMNAINPALIKNGVFVVPEILEQTREERQTQKGNNLIYSVCTVRYTFFADDGSSISAVVIGEGMDSGDKATNKAMSIAFKYACFQVFCIPTEEMKDPDAECHEVQPKQEPVNIGALKAVLENKGIRMETVLNLYKLNSIEDVTPAKYANIIKNIDNIKKKQEEKESE